MAVYHTKLYFLIYPRSQSNDQHAEAQISIQDFVLNKNLTQPSSNGNIALINDNYTVSVEYINHQTPEASIVITKKTPTGIVQKIYNTDLNGCDVYKDDDFIIALGVGRFELPNTDSEEENRAINKRNVEEIKRLTNLQSLEMISKKDYNNSIGANLKAYLEDQNAPLTVPNTEPYIETMPSQEELDHDDSQGETELGH